jgi:serine/threonine-protein kinase HipA
MARRRAGRLNVFLNSRHVGQLNRESSGAIDFRYEPTWLEWEHTLPVSLSLPLREERYIGAPVSNVFDNLLPDNDGIRKHVAARVSAEGIDAFSLLAALGRDCVGALQFLPDDIAPGPAGTIAGHPISDDEIAAMLGNLARNPLGLDDDADFRISIAGAQEKTALLWSEGRWFKPTGTTPTTHIFKPQIGQLPNGLDLSNSVENEFLCLKLTEAFGLPTAAVEMATFGDKRVLVVKRFDRLLTEDQRLLRVPQEDCCQALSVPWTIKYEKDRGPGIPQILKLLAASDEPSLDQRRFFKAQIVFWLLGATDGHAKNFSVFLSPGGGFNLTPLYDVLSAEPSLVSRQIRQNQMKLAMAVGTRRHYVIKEITARHFIQTAELAGIGAKVALELIDEVIASSPKALATVQSQLPKDYPAQIAEAVFAGIDTRVKILERSRNADEG